MKNYAIKERINKSYHDANQQGVSMKTLLLFLGLVAIAVGVFWLLQGLGYINWPENSTMIAQTNWAYYGGILAVVGLIIVWLSRR